MTRSNTANGGTSYFDLEIQTVSSSSSQVVYRAVVYLTSLPVTDTFGNALTVTGNWSRSGSANLGGSYNREAIWSQDQTFARTGSDYTVTANAAYSGVEYWGTTLSASASAVVPATAPSGSPPGAPSISAIDVTPTQATVVITGYGPDNGGSQDIQNYRLYRVWDNLVSNDQTKTGGFAIWAGLTRYTEYDAYVQSHNAYGWGPFSGPYRFRTPHTAPSQPPPPTVDQITDTSARIVLGLPADDGGLPINGYHVQVSRNSGFTDLVGDVIIADGPYTVTGLTRATNYWARYDAGNTAGAVSVMSPARAFTTLPSIPSAPTITSVTSISSTSAVVSWSPPVDNGGQTITTYEVQYSLDPSFATGVTTQSTGTLTGLTPGAVYHVRVRAVNASGPGPYSAPATFTTLTGLKYWTGSAWGDAPILHWSGTAWVADEVRIWNGTAWVPTG